MVVPSEVLLVWLPAAAILLFTLLGVFRGMWREVIVSLAIVLGALIVQQWAERWAGDLYEMFGGLSQGQHRFWLSVLLFGLTVLVIGYILGGQLVKRPLRASDRLLGGVLGLMNGAAIVGSILLFIYVGLDNIQTTSPVYQNPVSWSLMVWVGWFPVVLALVGAIIAVITPLRRAQAAVARPSAASDWQPSGAISTPTYTSTPTQPTTPTGAGSLAGTGAYGRPTEPAYVPTPSSGEPREPHPHPAPSVAPPPPAEHRPTEQSVPATTLPVREAAPTAQLPVAEAQPTREIEAEPPPWPQPSEPSWLVGSTRPAGTTEPPASATPTEQPRASDEVQAQVEPQEARQAQELRAGQEGAGVDAEVEAAQPQPQLCPNCGARAQEGAYFCTECGTRLRQ
jgi:uncharacterized membrane protein required for colicin V production/ribosomal protein L40E